MRRTQESTPSKKDWKKKKLETSQERRKRIRGRQNVSLGVFEKSQGGKAAGAEGGRNSMQGNHTIKQKKKTLGGKKRDIIRGGHNGGQQKIETSAAAFKNKKN